MVYFLKFFDQKITKLCSAFTSNHNVSPHIDPLLAPPHLSSFSPASTDEVKIAILKSSNASCDLDIIPTFLLKSCLDSLLLPITNIINLALSEGIFPDSFKSASVRPLLKKHNLPTEDLSSYRPISNLNFISKVLERIIHSRINNHLQTFPSICPFQSAYRKFHSTETALLRIQNDLLLASNQQKVSALVLLDLSAAFDTIDHQILLTRLSSTFGFSDTALSLLSPPILLTVLSTSPSENTALNLLHLQLAYLKDQFLVLFFLLCILHLLVTFFQTVRFLFTFTQMTHSFIYLFPPLSPLPTFPFYPPLLIASTPGLA